MLKKFIINDKPTEVQRQANRSSCLRDNCQTDVCVYITHLYHKEKKVTRCAKVFLVKKI